MVLVDHKKSFTNLDLLLPPCLGDNRLVLCRDLDLDLRRDRDLDLLRDRDEDRCRDRLLCLVLELER